MKKLKPGFLQQTAWNTARAIALLLCCGALTAVARADELHFSIDRLIEAAAPNARFAPVASDHEFLRRVYLDLAGRIPTADETRRFLDDASPAKRDRLIDELLGGDDYPRRMQEYFHVMLMERRGDNEDWEKFLRAAFQQNLPWHTFAAAILNPDTDNEVLRGAAFFHTSRLTKEGAMAPVDVPGLTRDVGRLFAGIDLQCAQCHDHLTVQDYSQQDFQGLHMVFENIDIRRDVKYPAIGEKLMTEPKEFSSVFEQVAMKTGPVVPGRGEVEIVTFEKGNEFLVPPDRKKRTQGVPRFSPLKELSKGLAASDNKLFCRNIANRLWFQMMGRGLTEPLDLHHSENPASHPALLEMLATEFAEHEFNVRWLLKELALTKTYQRSGVIPDDADVPSETTYTIALEKRLSAEQLFWSLGVATGEFSAVRRELAQKQNDATDESLTDQPTVPDFHSPEQLVAQSEALQSLRKSILKIFSNPPKEPETDFNPTVAGALFLMHSDEIQRLLQPRPGNLTDRALKLTSSEEIVSELFVNVLSRHPSAAETQAAAEFIGSDESRRPARISGLIWSLISSSEFGANH